MEILATAIQVLSVVFISGTIYVLGWFAGNKIGFKAVDKCQKRVHDESLNYETKKEVLNIAGEILEEMKRQMPLRKFVEGEK